MLKLKKIAITGGVASGKSSVCRIFKELGAFVVNADAIVHELLDNDTVLGQQIIRQFGPEISQNGNLSRRLIAEKVFEEPEKLDQLEKILHPAVLRRIEELYAEACRLGQHSLFVVEIPLLFEIRGESFYDFVIAVQTDEALARKRFGEAGFGSNEYDRRMRRQMPPQEKAKRAHYTIQNNGTLDELRKQVVQLDNRFKQGKFA